MNDFGLAFRSRSDLRLERFGGKRPV